MRYSSAVVLSTIAVGQAAAGNARHASFHARRQAEAKRSPGYEAVDWSKVSYDLSGVDWSSVFNSQQAAPTPSAQAAAYEPSQQAETTPAVTPTPTPEPTYEQPAATSEKAAAPSQTEASSSDPVGDFVSDVMQGVESIVKSLGISAVGANEKSDNGGIWIGDSPWKAQFINDASSDLVLFCWEANGFTGMTLNVNPPAISVGLKPGEKTEISFAPKVPAACAPAYSDTKLAQFGGIKQSWFELTLGKDGAFDVSRNVDMNGSSISAKGSKCTSDMTTCSFQCTNGADSCEKGSDYALLNCGAQNGGGSGYDTKMQGVGGGCSIGSDSETIVVTFT